MPTTAELSRRLRPADETIAANVRAVLARQRRSAASVARELDITERQFRQRTRGEVPFTGGELSDMARVLDVPAADLVTT